MLCKLFHPSSLGRLRSSTIFLASITCMYAARHTGSRTGRRCSRRVSEDSRPRRHRLELLDGSVGASGRGSSQCLAVENLARSGRRCRPRACPRRLQRVPRALERRRPWHPHPERSQSRVREAAIAETRSCELYVRRSTDKWSTDAVSHLCLPPRRVVRRNATCCSSPPSSFAGYEPPPSGPATSPRGPLAPGKAFLQIAISWCGGASVGRVCPASPNGNHCRAHR
jgi:hypothetical protein